MSDCLFCRIIEKKIPATFLYEDASMVAIQDINPQAPVHILILPKKHIAYLNDLEAADKTLIGDMVVCAKTIASDKKIRNGFRLVFNNGEQAGQSVFHIHLHLLGGRQMNWPPG